MNAVRRLIGDTTYYELQIIDSKVFPVVVNLGVNRSDHTDILAMFIDTDYTPELLLKDFKLIINSKEPVNKEVYKLIITGPHYTRGWEPTVLELIGFIFVMFIFWFTTLYTLSTIFFESPSIRNSFIRMDTSIHH
jgi:hypothetical protein